MQPLLQPPEHHPGPPPELCRPRECAHSPAPWPFLRRHVRSTAARLWLWPQGLLFPVRAVRLSSDVVHSNEAVVMTWCTEPLKRAGT